MKTINIFMLILINIPTIAYSFDSYDSDIFNQFIHDTFLFEEGYGMRGDFFGLYKGNNYPPAEWNEYLLIGRLLLQEAEDYILIYNEDDNEHFLADRLNEVVMVCREMRNGGNMPRQDDGMNAWTLWGRVVKDNIETTELGWKIEYKVQGTFGVTKEFETIVYDDDGHTKKKENAWVLSSVSKFGNGDITLPWIPRTDEGTPWLEGKADRKTDVLLLVNGFVNPRYLTSFGDFARAKKIYMQGYLEGEKLFERVFVVKDTYEIQSIQLPQEIDQWRIEIYETYPGRKHENVAISALIGVDQEILEWNEDPELPLNRVYTVGSPEVSMRANTTLTEGNVTYSVDKLANIMDGPWVPGRDLHGLDPKIEIEFRPISQIRFVNGFVSLEKPNLYYENNRVKSIYAYFHGGTDEPLHYTFELADTPGIQAFNIKKNNHPLLTLTIEDEYPGTKYNDTCLDYIDFVYQVDETSEGAP